MFRIFVILLSLSFYLFAGSIEGVVSYAGSNKTPKDLKMDSDPICGTAHSIPPKKEDFIPKKEDFSFGICRNKITLQHQQLEGLV